MAQKEVTFVVENAEIRWPNFTGKATPFRGPGTRSFALVLDKPFADQLAADEWNVKCKPVGVPTEDGNEDDIGREFCFLDVTVRFDVFPPNITMITDSGRTHLKEEMVEILDWADIRHVDLIVRAHDYNVNGNAGRKAYLKTMFVTVKEDELEKKYAMEEEHG